MIVLMMDGKCNLMIVRPYDRLESRLESSLESRLWMMDVKLNIMIVRPYDCPTSSHLLINGNILLLSDLYDRLDHGWQIKSAGGEGTNVARGSNVTSTRGRTCVSRTHSWTRG